MKCHIRLPAIFALLLVVFSTIYFIDLSIQPVYIVFIASLLFFFTYYRGVIISKEIVFSLLFIVYLITTQFVLDANTSTLGGFVFCIAYYVLTYNVLRYTSIEDVCKTSMIYIYISIFVGIIDAIWRFTHPAIETFYQGSKYYLRWKVNSLLFQDSNFVGMFLLVVFFYTIYFEKKIGRKLWIEKILIFLLCVLTFCRAAIFVLIVFSFIYNYNISKKAKTIVCVGAITFTAGYVWDYFKSDSSLGQRFELLRKTFEYMIDSKNLINKIIGVGLGNTVDIFGIGAHNFIVENIMEIGIVGMLMLIVLWVLIDVNTKNNARIIIVPFVIAGMALAPQYVPYMYVCFAIMKRLENDNNGSLKCY